MMRVLFVSNYYPPHFLGGYELGCRDIVELLGQRGYETLVLTSTYRVPVPTDERTEPGVRRQLLLDGFVPSYHPARFRREVANRRTFRAALAAFCPDLVYFWNQTRLPGSLVRLTRRAGLPYLFYLSDGSFPTWRSDSPWGQWVYPNSSQPLKAFAKSLLALPLGKLSLVESDQRPYYRPRQFTSGYIRSLADPTSLNELDRVIPWGVDVQRFSFRPRSDQRPVRLLYVGQIMPHKGTLTALQAVALLRDRFGLTDISLDVVGSTEWLAHLADLQAYVAENHLTECIHFLGKIDRLNLPAVYQQHDILIFPSKWEEPFAITPLEAMASGLVIVGTDTGGSREIFEQGKTALIFAPGDAAGCAEAVRTLVDDPALYQTLREAGRRLIDEKYTLSKMIDSIEQHLQVVVRGPSHSTPARQD